MRLSIGSSEPKWKKPRFSLSTRSLVCTEACSAALAVSVVMVRSSHVLRLASSSGLSLSRPAALNCSAVIACSIGGCAAVDCAKTGSVQPSSRVNTSRIDERMVCSSGREARSEEHTYELQALMRSSYDVICLKKKNSLE